RRNPPPGRPRAPAAGRPRAPPAPTPWSARPPGQTPSPGHRVHSCAAAAFDLLQAMLFGEGAIAIFQRLDQAVDAAAADLLAEAAAVVGDQAHAGDDDVEHLPALLALLQHVVDADRLRAGLDDLGADLHAGVGRSETRGREDDALVTVLGQRVRVGAHEQGAEGIGELRVLVRRR